MSENTKIISVRTEHGPARAFAADGWSIDDSGNLSIYKHTSGTSEFNIGTEMIAAFADWNSVGVDQGASELLSRMSDDDLRAEAARRGMTILDAEQARIERDARNQIAKAVREHCTITDDEAMKRGGDYLIAAVADWIENPPEWVKL